MGDEIININGNEVHIEFGDQMGNSLSYVREYEDYACIFSYQYIIRDENKDIINDIDAALKFFKEKDIFKIGDSLINLFDK